MYPPPRNRAEAQAVIDALATRDAEIRRDDDKESRYIRNAQLFLKYAYLFGSLIAAIAIWVAGVQWTTQINDRRIEKLEAHSEAMRDIIQTLQSTQVANRVERVSALDKVQVDIDALKKDLPKVTHMWSMRLLGINNSDAYRRSKPGFDPSNPESAPDN